MASYPNDPTVTVVLGVANSDGTFTGVISGTSTVMDPGQRDTLSVAVIGNGTITGGTLVLEEAYQVPGTTYAGTWSQLLSISATALSGGAQQVTHLVPSSLVSVRARITSSITGGGGVTVVCKEQ